VTAVSELAHNLHFHTHLGGTISLAALDEGGRIGVEVVSEDQGPGIPDIDLAMQDGFSTNRGLGGGLPGVRRLMDEFSIRSEVGVGTRVVARLWRP
jgi:serine/threonine-protein kinase RsbT